MNEIMLAAYKVLYNEGAFFLRTEQQWAEL